MTEQAESKTFNGEVTRIFKANTLQIIAFGLTTVFVSSFIWRYTGSFLAVAAYPLGVYLVQPLVFGVNGWLLRKVHLRTLFLFGALLGGISGFVVVLFAATTNPFIFFLLGMLKAIGFGFYWPNRNYLELREIVDGARNYYFSLIHAAMWVLNTVIPFLAGWFIVLGPKFNLFSTQVAYVLIFLGALAFMALAGLTVFRGPYATATPETITRFFQGQPLWNERRLINFAHGIVNGVSFIIPLLVLMFLGSEGILGTTTAITALLAAAVIYLYGTYSNASHRYGLVKVGTFGYLLCAALLLFLPAPWNAIIYVLFAKLASDFFYVGAEPILLARSDSEMNGNGKMRYSFIVDNEFFLCAGRVIGITLLMLMAFAWSESTSLLYGPLVVAILQLGLFAVALRMRRFSNISSIGSDLSHQK